MKHEAHASALGALDQFFRVVREHADRDPGFAIELVNALKVPIEIRIGETHTANDALPFVDPVAMVSGGLDAFRKTAGAFSPAELKKLLKEHNLVSPDELTGKKKPALIELLWEGANARRASLEKRVA